MKLRYAIVLAAAAAGILTSCSNTVTAPPTVSLESVQTTTPTPAATVTAPPTVTVPVDQPPGDAAASATAVDVATAFMSAFARPDLPEGEWFDGISGFLTPYAQDAYKLSDPAQVRARQLTGSGVLLEGSSDKAAQVDIPTDAGTYTVQLSRYLPSQPWQVDRAIPPAGS